MAASKERVAVVALLVAALLAITVVVQKGSPPAPLHAADPSNAASGQGRWQSSAEGPTPPPVGRTPTFVASPLSELKLESSSFKCTDEENLALQTCEFYNLVIHQGDTFYIVQDELDIAATKLPNPTLFEVSTANYPNAFRFAVGNTIQVATAEATLARVAENAAGMGKRGKAGGEAQAQVAQFELAILQRTRSYSNWFWALNGAGNMYHRLCKYLGACMPEEVQAAAVLQPTATPTGLPPELIIGAPDTAWASIHELMSCFGPLFMLNHPALWKNRTGAVPDNRVVVLRRVLAGIGHDVVEPLSAKGPNEPIVYAQADAEMGALRMAFLRQCAGVAPRPAPLRRPSVLLVNRPYADGRHIIGLDDVYDRLQRRLPPDADVRLYLPRVESLAAQAAVYTAANVLVVPHGANNANFLFLPQDAVVLTLFAVDGLHALDVAHAESLPSPPYNITVVPVDCKAFTEVRPSVVAEMPAFQALTPEQQADLLRGGVLTRDRVAKIRRLLKLSAKDWMDASAYRPDPEALADKVLQAVELWRQKAEARMASQ